MRVNEKKQLLNRRCLTQRTDLKDKSLLIGIDEADEISSDKTHRVKSE